MAQELVDGPFADALRAVLFLDPDRIKVGHLQIAIEFATPHTTSTRDTSRLILPLREKRVEAKSDSSPARREGMSK